MTLCGVPAGLQAAELPMQHVDQAVFEGADGRGITVPLPDTWRQRGLAPGSGRYRARFTLGTVPEDSVALMFTRLSTQHRVHVNGMLVSGTAGNSVRSDRGVPAPALIAMPPPFLKAGSNEVTIEVNCAMRAGLSGIEIGPMPVMRERFQRYMLLNVSLPQAMNLACAGVALLLILVWWQRRSEVALGSFGVLALIGALRNYSYFVPPAMGSVQIWDWVFFAVQAWTLVLFGIFAQAFAQVRWPRYTRCLVVGAAAVSLIGAGVAMEGQLQAVRGWAYPVMLAASLPAFWLCIGRARTQPVWGVVLQSLGVAALLVAVAHDYAFQTAALLPITENFWQPYTMPVLLGAISLALVQRMVHALGEVERLNAGLEARVAERTRELEQANAAKSRFLAAASHDLRQPLVTIGLLVGMAKEGTGSVGLRALMDRIDGAVSAMERLLTGLLDLSRLEAGAVRPRPAPVRLDALLASIELHEQAAAAVKGLRLRCRPTREVAHTDPVMLERIVLNLVSNAIRYAERGTVLVAVRRAGAGLRLEVRDSGIGIAPEHQQAIFEEFVQVNNPARDAARGLGLGLAIVQRSAAKLGHKLGLRSAPGRGSCFWIELPRAAAQDATEPRAQAPRPTLQGRRVLVVEDDASVRAALRDRLRSWGAEVHNVEGLPPLRRWLAQAPGRPDLVVTDYRLPTGDGLQVLAAVAEQYANVPAVVITGDTAPADLTRLHAAGVRVLHKPFRPEALLDVLGAPQPAETIAPC
jgi:signal transduction histidine kinase/CheY-like chemotaxis protein